MSYLYLKSPNQDHFWSEVKLGGTKSKFVQIRALHVQSQNPWNCDGTWHRNGYLKIDNIPFPKKPGEEHKLYFERLTRQAWDFDTMKSMLVHAQPLKKIDWFNNTFMTLNPWDFRPKLPSPTRSLTPDASLARNFAANASSSRETPKSYDNSSIINTKTLVNTFASHATSSTKKNVTFGVETYPESPQNDTSQIEESLLFPVHSASTRPVADISTVSDSNSEEKGTFEPASLSLFELDDLRLKARSLLPPDATQSIIYPEPSSTVLIKDNKETRVSNVTHDSNISKSIFPINISPVKGEGTSTPSYSLDSSFLNSPPNATTMANPSQSFTMTEAQLQSLIQALTPPAPATPAASATTSSRYSDAKQYHEQLRNVKLEKKDVDSALVFLSVLKAVFKAAKNAGVVANEDAAIRTFYTPLMFRGEVSTLFNSMSDPTWNQDWILFGNSVLRFCLGGRPMDVLYDRWYDFKHTPGVTTLFDTKNKLVLYNQLFRFDHDDLAIKRHLVATSTSARWRELVYRHQFFANPGTGLTILKWDSNKLSLDDFVEQVESVSASLPSGQEAQLAEFTKEVHRQINSLEKKVQHAQKGKGPAPSRTDVFSFVTHESNADSAPELPDLATAPDSVVQMYLAVASDWLKADAEATGVTPPTSTDIYNFTRRVWNERSQAQDRYRQGFPGRPGPSYGGHNTQREDGQGEPSSSSRRLIAIADDTPCGLHADCLAKDCEDYRRIREEYANNRYRCEYEIPSPAKPSSSSNLKQSLESSVLHPQEPLHHLSPHLLHMISRSFNLGLSKLFSQIRFDKDFCKDTLYSKSIYGLSHLADVERNTFLSSDPLCVPSLHDLTTLCSFLFLYPFPCVVITPPTIDRFYVNIFQSLSLSSPILLRCLPNEPTVPLPRSSSYVIWHLSSAANPEKSFSTDLDESLELVPIPDTNLPSPLFRLNRPHANDPRPISPQLQSLLRSPEPPARRPTPRHVPVPITDATRASFHTLAQQALPLPNKEKASVIFPADVHDYMLKAYYPRDRRPKPSTDLKALMALESSVFSVHATPSITAIAPSNAPDDLTVPPPSFLMDSDEVSPNTAHIAPDTVADTLELPPSVCPDAESPPVPDTTLPVVETALATANSATGAPTATDAPPGDVDPVAMVAIDDAADFTEDLTTPTVVNPTVEPRHTITLIRGRLHGVLLPELLLDSGANVNLIDSRFLKDIILKKGRRAHYRPYRNPESGQGVGGSAKILGEVMLTLSLGNDYTYRRTVKFKVVDNLPREALIGTPVINLFKIDQLTSQGVCRFHDDSQYPPRVFETPLKTYEDEAPPPPPSFHHTIPIRSSAAYTIDAQCIQPIQCTLDRPPQHTHPHYLSVPDKRLSRRGVDVERALFATDTLFPNGFTYLVPPKPPRRHGRTTLGKVDHSPMHLSVTNVQSTSIDIPQGTIVGYLVDLPEDYVNSVIKVPSIFEDTSHTPDLMFMISELMAHPEITTTETLAHHFQTLADSAVADVVPPDITDTVTTLSAAENFTHFLTTEKSHVSSLVTQSNASDLPHVPTSCVSAPHAPDPGIDHPTVPSSIVDVPALSISTPPTSPISERNRYLRWTCKDVILSCSQLPAPANFDSLSPASRLLGRLAATPCAFLSISTRRLDTSDLASQQFLYELSQCPDYNLYVTSSDDATSGVISLVSTQIPHRVLDSSGKCPLSIFTCDYTPPLDSPFACFAADAPSDTLDLDSSEALDKAFQPDSVTPWVDSSLPDPSAVLPADPRTLPPPKDSTLEEKMDYLRDPKSLSDDELLAQIDLAHVTDDARRRKLISFLKEYGDVFRPHVVTGLQSPGEHTIELKPYARAPNSAPYPEGIKRAAVIGEHINTMLKDNIIRPSRSPFAAPVCLVRKKDGSLRFCTDFRRLNDVTIKDKYPLPKIDDTFNHLAGMCLFTSLDLLSGFWQIPIKEEDKPKTAFITSQGLYEYNVMPFGLTNSPPTFQRCMDMVLAGLKWTRCMVYIDDIIIFSKNDDDHFQNLRLVFDRLKEYNLKLKPSKCHFMFNTLPFLGHIITPDGVKTDSRKVSKLKDWPTPKNVKDLQMFLGFANYFKRFLPDFSDCAYPLYQLLKTDVPFIWTDSCESAFHQLISYLLRDDLVLVLPNADDKFVISCDASKTGLGAALFVVRDGVYHPVSFASRTLTEVETRYSNTDREGLAVVWASNTFEDYTWGSPYRIETDHAALIPLFSCGELTGRFARYMYGLQHHDIELVHKPGKSQAVADALSRSFGKIIPAGAPSPLPHPYVYIGCRAHLNPSPGDTTAPTDSDAFLTEMRKFYYKDRQVVSLNVNSLHAFATKLYQRENENPLAKPTAMDLATCLISFFDSKAYDVICLQETRVSPKRDNFWNTLHNLQGWWTFSSDRRNGSNGVMTFVRKTGSVQYFGIIEGMDISKEYPCTVARPSDEERIGKFGEEGRILTVLLNGMAIINVYVPNGSRHPERQTYKREFLNNLHEYTKSLMKERSNFAIIVAGDLNIAHTNFDVCDPSEYQDYSGFTNFERKWFSDYLKLGFVDGFRNSNPKKPGYTWHDPERGYKPIWRVDYMLIDKRIQDEKEFIVTHHWDDKLSDHERVSLTFRSLRLDIDKESNLIHMAMETRSRKKKDDCDDRDKDLKSTPPTLPAGDTVELSPATPPGSSRVTRSQAKAKSLPLADLDLKAINTDSEEPNTSAPTKNDSDTDNDDYHDIPPLPAEKTKLTPKDEQLLIGRTHERISQLQREDPDFKDIIAFKDNGTLPEDKEDQDRIRLISDTMYYDRNRKLLYKLSFISQSMMRRAPMRLGLCVPNGLRREVCILLHDDIFSGHQGYAKVIPTAMERFWWPNMARDLKDYVRTCHVCQKSKDNLKHIPTHQPVPFGAKPWDRVCVDIIGPLKLSQAGNKYIVVLTDYFTRYAIAIPVPEITVEVVARALVEKIFCYFGIPAVIHTDQGQPFTSQTMSMVSKALGTKQAFSMPYNPQGHGVVERFNKTLCKMLRAYVDQETHNDWDEFIPYVTYAYVTSIHAVLKEAPFYLMFGREAILPADLRAGVNSDDIYAEDHPNDTFNHVQVLLANDEEKFALMPPFVEHTMKPEGDVRVVVIHNKHLKSLYRSIRELYCKYPIDESRNTQLLSKMTTDLDIDVLYVSYSNSAPQELPKYVLNRTGKHLAVLNRFRIYHSRERTVYLYVSNRINPHLVPFDAEGNLYKKEELIACPDERLPNKGKPLHDGLSSPIMITIEKIEKSPDSQMFMCTSQNEGLQSEVYAVDTALFQDFLDDHRLHVQDFIKQLPARLALAKALNEAIHEQLSAKTPKKFKQPYQFEIGDKIWLSTPLRSLKAKKKTKEDEDDGSLIAKFMFRWAGPMRIVSKSDDGLRFIVVEELPNNTIIARVTHANRIRPFTPATPIDSAEKAAAAVRTDNFEEEVRAWEKVRVAKRRPTTKVAVGIKKELLRRFDPDLVDDPENKQYYIEKLDSHTFDSKKQVYIYRVKWLGYTDYYDLLVSEPEIPASIVEEYWDNYARIHGNQSKEMNQRRSFAKKHPEKLKNKVSTPVEKTLPEDNTGIDASAPKEKLQPGECYVPIEASLNPSKGSVWSSR